jgi:soluble lytic murein transglycosylase
MSQRALLRIVLLLAVVAGAVYAVFFGLPSIFAEIRYPLTYENIIVKESSDHNLDPFLVAAVIYSESHYNPRALSPVGARGLMQLMPLTAAGIARKLGDTSFIIDDLYDPATNIRYGTFHLQGLMARYNGAVEPAIVAYNGGGGAGDKYLAGNKLGVPKESLAYVQRVLQVKIAYQQLYQLQLAGIDPFARKETKTTLATQVLGVIQQTVNKRLSQ